MTPVKTPSARDSQGLPIPIEAAADALFRSAAEAARQHERVAKLNERHAHHSEMQEATELREAAHRHLKARAALYEASAAAGKGTCDDAYWHAANTMWHTARDYCRRACECDATAKKLTKHSPDALNALAMDYELEGSALLAMRNAMAAYRKLRPDVSLF